MAHTSINLSLKTLRSDLLPTSERGESNIPTREEVEAELLDCGCKAWTLQFGCTDEHRCCKCHDRIQGCRACGGYGVAPSENFPDLAQIPQLYRKARLSNWTAPPDESALIVSQCYGEEWPPSKPFLVFMSPVKGNGKTRLAVSVMYDVWGRHKQRSQFWPVVELLDAYRATNREDAPWAIDTLETMLRKMPLLVIDDLGAQKETDYARERLYGLINYRYNELLPTIITANVGPQQLDERIASRLQDHRLSCVEVLEGPDRRRRP